MRLTLSFFAAATALSVLGACGDTSDTGSGGSSGTTTGSGGDPTTTTTGAGGDMGPACGDGELNGTEVCDGTLLDGETCATLGFDGGALACTTACVLDTSDCTNAWDEVAYLKAANTDPDDAFGVSIASSGDTIVVGAMLEDSNQTTITNGAFASTDDSTAGAGAVYVYARAGGNWGQQAYLKPSNTGSDYFGQSIGISGDTIVVGALYESSNQTTITNGSTASTDNSAQYAGAAYVFSRTGANWSQQAYLKAPNAQPNDYFGHAVAISGDTVVVSAVGEASNQTTITNGAGASSDNSAFYAGAVYVFTRAGTTWSQQAYLKAANADASDQLGYSLAISGDTVVAGAAFEASNQTTITNGGGASTDDSAINAGAAYVFTRSGTTWSQQAYLKGANAEGGDFFGNAVGIAGDTIVVTSLFEGSNQSTVTNGAGASADNSASGAGAAYVYLRSGTTWTQQAYLKAVNAAADDAFGSSVAISGDTIVVGAEAEDSNQITVTSGPGASTDDSADGAGAAYVFTRSGTLWSPQAYLKAANARAGGTFGKSIAIAGATVAVGAWGDASNQNTVTNGPGASADTSAPQAGAAYVFEF